MSRNSHVRHLFWVASLKKFDRRVGTGIPPTIQLSSTTECLRCHRIKFPNILDRQFIAKQNAHAHTYKVTTGINHVIFLFCPTDMETDRWGPLERPPDLSAMLRRAFASSTLSLRGTKTKDNYHYGKELWGFRNLTSGLPPLHMRGWLILFLFGTTNSQERS